MQRSFISWLLFLPSGLRLHGLSRGQAHSGGMEASGALGAPPRTPWSLGEPQDSTEPAGRSVGNGGYLAAVCGALESRTSRPRIPLLLQRGIACTCHRQIAACDGTATRQVTFQQCRCQPSAQLKGKSPVTAEKCPLRYQDAARRSSWIPWRHPD
ncbi:hypothetical protein EDB80DRAFT_814910 [Ilyonectria destructans]|nr:hypothetical protein EDB80DRAFT_814910 [Ilyonectria destructans]